MLGYVVTFKPEMKVREAELYKAYYCGICKSIGRRYGQLPRFILSYDAAFLATVLDGFFEESVRLDRERCIAHPQKKEAIASCHAIDFAADVMLILAWYKALDDIHDEASKKAKVFVRIFKNKFKVVKNKHKKLCEDIEIILKKLGNIEDEKCDSIDKAAESFAKIMEVINIAGISYIYDIKVRNGQIIENKDIRHQMEIAQTVLARVGYHLGKWIYLMDALDDIEENIHSGAYNPLIYRFKYEKDEDISAFRKRIKPMVERNLLIYLSEMGKAFDLLDFKKNKGIIENIVYVGLLKKTEEILNKGELANESV